MREVDVAGLAAPNDVAPEPFVRHQLDPGTVRRAWVAEREGVRGVERAALWVAEIVWHDHAGRGLGSDLSVALTRAGLAMAPVVSLGVYLDNAPALRIHRALGDAMRHTFASGLTARPGGRPAAQRAGTERWSTSADSPSR